MSVSVHRVNLIPFISVTFCWERTVAATLMKSKVKQQADLPDHN